MSSRSPTRQVPLAQQVLEILTDRIREGIYPPDSQLPPENDLAAEFRVSRATVRSALNTLAARGMVIRRHGAGTFVTRLPKITNPLDEAIDFQELIARFCCEPGVEHIYCAIQSASERMAEALQIEPGAEVLVSQKIFTADGDPMIYCVNTISTWMFDRDLLEEVINHPEIIEPIYDFLERRCNQRVEHHIAKIRPSIAEDCRFHHPLPVDPYTPVLVIDEIACNAEGRPLFHTFEYHPENQMSFELIRRRTLSR